jgi:hypothetical protein
MYGKEEVAEIGDLFLMFKITNTSLCCIHHIFIQLLDIVILRTEEFESVQRNLSDSKLCMYKRVNDHMQNGD